MFSIHKARSVLMVLVAEAFYNRAAQQSNGHIRLEAQFNSNSHNKPTVVWWCLIGGSVHILEDPGEVKLSCISVWGKLTGCMRLPAHHSCLSSATCQKLQLANIRRSLEAQRTKASGRTACLQLEDFKGQIDDLLWKQLSLESDQEKRNLVR